MSILLESFCSFLVILLLFCVFVALFTVDVIVVGTELAADVVEAAAAIEVTFRFDMLPVVVFAFVFVIGVVIMSVGVAF